MNFEQWYASHEWWHEPEEELKEVWDALVAKGFSNDEAAKLIGSVVSAIRNEYGD
jgi:polyhydroxyalkanoate synthesis regulator phasin